MYIMEAVMQVSKWGNSLAIRLPKKLVEELGLKEGDNLDVVDAKQKTISVARARRREEVLRELDKFRFHLPDDYKFDAKKPTNGDGVFDSNILVYAYSADHRRVQASHLIADGGRDQCSGLE